MASQSPDVLWAILRKQNKFVVKRSGLQLTSEPGNLTAENTFKASGLANGRAVGIAQSGPSEATLTIAKKAGNKPRSASRAVKLNATRGPKAVASTIEKEVDSTFYRRDLTSKAVARYSALHRAMRAEKKGVEFKPKTRSSRR